MLMENNVMSTEYHDFMSYIFSENPSIENVLFLNDQKINKYEFIFRSCQIMPFGSKLKDDEYPLSVAAVSYTFNNACIKSCPYDNDIKQLYEIVREQIKALKKEYVYDLFFDTLIKMSIVLENNYLCKDKKVITYKSDSFNIDHVLYFVEERLDIMGIREAGHNKTRNTYNFYSGMNTLIRRLHLADTNYYSNINLNSNFYTILFEILLLLTNTYNEHMKELYCNEW